nr:hypothetical protein [Tanacetum cinerariifolium]
MMVFYFLFLSLTLFKKSQELKTVSYHKLYDILKQHQNEVNEIRAERIARTANPLALITQQQPVYHPQNHPTHYTQNSLTRSQQAATRKRGKAIVNSPLPIYNQEPSMVAEDDEIGAGYDNQRIEQADWRDGTDDESKEQELEAHYMYMAQIQEVSPDAADSGPIFDAEPLQKVSNDDHYNVFAIESKHPEQSKSIHDTYPIEQDEHNMIIDSLDMSYDREQIDQNDDDDDDLANEHELLASLIEKLKCEIDNSKNHNNILETSNKDHFKFGVDFVERTIIEFMELIRPYQPFFVVSPFVHNTFRMTQDGVWIFLVEASFHEPWLCQVELCLIAFNSQRNVFNSFLYHYLNAELNSINQIMFIHAIDVMDLVLNLKHEQIFNVVLVQI